jgi:hypothetical protein
MTSSRRCGIASVEEHHPKNRLIESLKISGDSVYHALAMLRARLFQTIAAQPVATPKY